MPIALPAALALAADPITSLVDTAFVGHLGKFYMLSVWFLNFTFAKHESNDLAGSAELAAVGVSVSVFNLVSKLFNVPLLNVTTSFVAEEQAFAIKDVNDSSQTSTYFSLIQSIFLLRDCLSR